MILDPARLPPQASPLVTLDEARRILGPDAAGIPDDQLEQHLTAMSTLAVALCSQIADSTQWKPDRLALLHVRAPSPEGKKAMTPMPKTRIRKPAP